MERSIVTCDLTFTVDPQNNIVEISGLDLDTGKPFCQSLTLECFNLVIQLFRDSCTEAYLEYQKDDD